MRRLDRLVDPETAFVELYGESKNAFWLDSSRPGEGARFSYIGDDAGRLGKAVYHRVGEGEPIFDRLARELTGSSPAGPELPFEFRCGLVGWFGYELKAECGGDAAHRSPLPDAALIFAARAIAFDHTERCTYLLALTEPGCEAEAERWLDATEARLAVLPDAPTGRFPTYMEGNRPVGGEFAAEPRLVRSRERYLEEIEECGRLLAGGETYEVCLTNAVQAELGAGETDPPDPLELYRTLRRLNPAPFSAFLRFGDVAVLSSSPERFLRIDRDGRVEAKPIKGTSRRGETPAEDARLAERLRSDEKSRAENLMIADLLRNDLGSVCEVGTVHVPSLMEVESYETVHQLVTTVRGRLREGLGPLDAVRACFPPGSMTGAPKRRTMEIIDRLEGGARGPYSGAIGWLGPGGACDLSVAIRSIVLDGERARIGAGGAIVALSDPEEEYEEMLLKAAASVCALDFGPPGSQADPPRFMTSVEVA